MIGLRRSDQHLLFFIMLFFLIVSPIISFVPPHGDFLNSQQDNQIGIPSRNQSRNDIPTITKDKENHRLRPPASPSPITNYSIQALLETDIHALTAHSTINYVNHANVSLSELVFHIYPNAFLPEGNITIIKIESAGNDIPYTISGSDDTILTVDLDSVAGPGPVAPDHNTTVYLQYRVNIPNERDRFGWYHTTSPGELLAYNLGNWHPIVAVYDDRGWHTAPYTFMGESFYSDVAIYDVELRVPETYIVAATGELQEVIDDPGISRTWHWITGPVRDFTWCASPHYNTASILVNGVNVTSYHTVGHTQGGQRVLEVAEQCLNIYGDLFGPYVWASLRIVETDFWAGGMEYPQLVMISDSLYGNPEGLSYLAIVVAHEIGHEWVPFSIGTDSHAEPWIDEGFASYCEFSFVEYVYGEHTRSSYREFNMNDYWSYVNDAGDKSVNQSIDYWEGLGWYHYGNIVYTKASLVYDMLRHQLGNATFYQAWQYIYSQTLHENVRATDLQQLFEEAVGQSLDWFFDRWVFGSGVVTINLGGAISHQGPTEWMITFELHQIQSTPVALFVPIQVNMIDRGEVVWVWMDAAPITYHQITVSALPQNLILDPQNLLLCQYYVRETLVSLSTTSPLFQQILVGVLIAGILVATAILVYVFVIRRRPVK